MFEYKTIKTKGKIGMLKKDAMESLGYEICETKAGATCFKRNFKHSSNEKLKKLEKDILDSCDKIEKCERNRKTAPQAVAIIWGIIACLTMGGGMSLCLAYDKMLIGCIVGSIGILLMIPPYFLYNVISEKNNCKVLSTINQEYDKINMWCESATEIIKSDVE